MVSINLNIPMQQLTEMLLYIFLFGIDEVEFILTKRNILKLNDKNIASNENTIIK
jgi:hypothetical protein